MNKIFFLSVLAIFSQQSFANSCLLFVQESYRTVLYQDQIEGDLAYNKKKDLIRNVLKGAADKGYKIELMGQETHGYEFTNSRQYSYLRDTTHPKYQDFIKQYGQTPFEALKNGGMVAEIQLLSSDRSQYNLNHNRVGRIHRDWTQTAQIQLLGYGSGDGGFFKFEEEATLIVAKVRNRYTSLLRKKLLCIPGLGRSCESQIDTPVRKNKTVNKNLDDEFLAALPDCRM
jgi:hypothetical protein